MKPLSATMVHGLLSIGNCQTTDNNRAVVRGKTAHALVDRGLVATVDGFPPAPKYTNPTLPARSMTLTPAGRAAYRAAVGALRFGLPMSQAAAVAQEAARAHLPGSEDPTTDRDSEPADALAEALALLVGYYGHLGDSSDPTGQQIVEDARKALRQYEAQKDQPKT